MSNTSKTHKTRKVGESGRPRQSPARNDVPTQMAPPPSDATTTPLALSPDSLADLSLLAHRAAGEDGVVTIGVPTELPPQKQYWYRTRDSKTKKLFDKILVMREAGRPDADIAKRLKTTEANVSQTVWIGKKNGWLDADDEPYDLEAELALNIDRKVVRNISSSLDGNMTNWQTHEMTMAAAKGRGVFKTDAAKGETVGMQVVAIQVVMPTLGAGDQMPEVLEDQMGGVPAYLDAEVVDEQRTLDAGQAADSEPTPEGAVGAESV